MWSIDEHDFNRMMAALDLTAFILVTPEILNNTILKRIHVKSSQASSAVAQATELFLLSRPITIMMNVVAVFSFLGFILIGWKGFDYQGPTWLRVLIWTFDFLAFIPVFAIAISLLLGSVTLIIWVLSNRTRLLLIGIMLFVSARIAILVHG